ncbi:MAG: AAA family ATPase [Candidatus Thorarchaeota archaeon]
MNQFLIAMCGIPSSGKSVLAKAILENVRGKMKVEIVSTDDWRDEGFYADFKPENERQVRKDALRYTKELIGNGVSVIHDDTNYYTSMRHELFEVAIDRPCNFAVIHVSTSVETAIQWNKERGTLIPEEVILRISGRLDPPGSKYAWDTAISVVDMSMQTAEVAAREIMERLEVLVPLGNSMNHVMTKSPSSDALIDVVTRQVVTRFLGEHPEYRGDMQVSRLRRELLKEGKRAGISPDKIEQVLMERLKNLDIHAPD